MDRTIYINIFNRIPFMEVLRLSRVSKLAWIISQTDEYWQQRAVRSGILHVYRRSSFITESKVRYAWSVVKYIGFVIGPDFDALSDIVAYLQNRKDLLFPVIADTSLSSSDGLWFIIGMFNFMKRCVDLDNLEMLKHVISLGSYSIGEIRGYAIDIGRENIARYLSEVCDIWLEYNARYHDVRYDCWEDYIAKNQYDSSDRSDHKDHKIFLLVKYGKLDLQESDRVDPKIQRAYLKGLLARLSTSGIFHDPNEIENRFIRFTRIYDHVTNSPDLGKLTVPTVKAYLNIVPWDVVRYRVNYLISVATRENNVPLVKYLLGRVDILYIDEVYIKSLMMLEVLLGSRYFNTNHADEHYTKIYMVIDVDYRVVNESRHLYCPNYFVIEEQDHVPMFIIQHDHFTKQPVNLFEKFLDLSVQEVMLPYLYDFMKSLGMSTRELRCEGSIFVNIDSLPYLKRDLISKGRLDDFNTEINLMKERRRRSKLDD